MSNKNNKSEKDLDEIVNQIEALTGEGSVNEVIDDVENAAGLSMPTDADAENIDADADVDNDGFEGANIVSLYDEDGNEYSFELVDYVDYEDKLYAIMIPEELSDEEDDQLAVIMETYFEGDEPNFVFVEDEELAQKILDSYSGDSGE